MYAPSSAMAISRSHELLVSTKPEPSMGSSGWGGRTVREVWDWFHRERAASPFGLVCSPCRSSSPYSTESISDVGTRSTMTTASSVVGLRSTVPVGNDDGGERSRRSGRTVLVRMGSTSRDWSSFQRSTHRWWSAS